MKRFQFMGALAACSLGMTLGACADESNTKDPVGFKITTSALTLPGVGDACYNLTVRHATTDPSGGNDNVFDAAGDVWTQTGICGRQYGSKGAITYIGTCDADNSTEANPGADGSAYNEVQIVLTSLTDDSDQSISESTFRNPCKDGLLDSDLTGATPDPAEPTCKKTLLCTANTDTLAAFNITLMRDANQGFFDVAVNFEDIFCSAKFDTCYNADTQASDTDGPDWIKLLFKGADRGRTAVLAIACTRGQDNSDGTDLFLSDVAVNCGGTLNFDETTDGNGADPTGATGVFGYAVYRGQEASNDIVYYNVAVGFNDGTLPTTCNVSATASAGERDSDHFTSDAGVWNPPAGSYPLITVDADVVDASGNYQCVQWGLNEVAADDSTPVATTYTGDSYVSALKYVYDGVHDVEAAP